MPTKPTNPPIGDRFDVAFERPIVDAGGGLPAFAVTDRRGGSERLMAVQVPDGQAPRARALPDLGPDPVPFCLTPRAHGLARRADGIWSQFVICAAPPGQSLSHAPAAAPWSEQELLDTLLRPVAAALAALAALPMTHRAIRADNVFQTARGQPVMLGCAWAASPARHQPAVYEPPYSAVCPPAWRDEGAIADDVYALGVLMVALARGAVPLAGLDAEAIVTRKIEVGSVAAIIGDGRLPPTIVDLARGMLAEDPDHRPTPALLADPGAARSRRVAARPRRRAQRSIAVGARFAWDARGLAHALASEPGLAIAVLRSGAVDQWLRRSLGDVSLALVLEEASRQHAAENPLDDQAADAVLLLRAVAVLDPLAPLCWMGLRIWPDALGSALAASTAEEHAALGRMVGVEATATWAFARAHRCDPVRAQTEARRLRAAARQRGWGGGLTRLRYASNPLLPCRSPVLGGATVVGLGDLLAALERAAERVDRPLLPFDPDLAAFVSARLGGPTDGVFAAMGPGATDPAAAAMAQLRVLTRVQDRHAGGPVPRLAAWMAAGCDAVLMQIRHRARQAATRASLDQQIAAGRLAGVLGVLENRAVLAADARDWAVAAAMMARLDQDILGAERRVERVRADARRLGSEIAASIGVSALALAVIGLVAF